MKVTKVQYQKIYPTGINYLNHRVGVEIDLDETDNPDEAFKLARKLVEEWNAESNPSYALTMEYMEPQEGAGEYSWDGKAGAITPMPPKESAIESHIKTINECKTLNNLKIFEKLVTNSNSPELTQAYTKRHQELFMNKKQINEP